MPRGIAASVYYLCYIPIIPQTKVKTYQLKVSFYSTLRHDFLNYILCSGTEWLVDSMQVYASARGDSNVMQVGSAIGTVQRK